MSVEEEAALWVARLQSPDATAQDRARFNDWRARDPAHGATYDEIQALWGALAQAPLRQPRRFGGATVAAVVLALGLGAAAFGPELALRLRADAIAGIGQIAHLTLPDGSRLDLDSGAAVRLDFDGPARNVHVLRGTVFAEVVPDAARPFTILAGDLAARAIGTRYGASATDVTVTHGTVQASLAADGSTGEGLILQAGEAAQVDGAGLSLHPADPAATAWRGGQLVFSQRPLSEVLAELRRYRHGRIVLLDGAAAGRKVSGVFDIGDTDAALAALAQGLGLRLTHLPGLTVLR